MAELSVKSSSLSDDESSGVSFSLLGDAVKRIYGN